MKTHNVHILVAPSPWDEDPLLYRRHRLAKFLKDLNDTEQVIWICPKVSPSLRLSTIIKIETLENGIIQILVSDFKSLIRHIHCLQKSLCNEVLAVHNSLYSYYLWFTYPAFASLIKLNIWEDIIYDCSDMWIHSEQSTNYFFNKIKRKMISTTETNILGRADHCFASSVNLRDNLDTRGKKSVEIIENGVDFSKFNEISCNQYRLSHKPVLGFIGGLKPWKIDFKLLLECGRKRPDWDIVLIGPSYGEINEDLSRESNIRVLPQVSPEVMAGFISAFDVGILPYLNNEYNKGVFPLKFFEYLACGVPVVGCGLPSTTHYVKEHIYEYSENNVDNFVEACQRAIDGRAHNVGKRKELARAADWNNKFETMWNSLRQFTK